MLHCRTLIAAAAFAALLPAGFVAAQPAPTPPQTQSAQPAPAAAPATRTQKIGKKTKETVARMKANWVAREAKWRDCRAQAKAQRLSGKKTREFLDRCVSQ